MWKLKIDQLAFTTRFLYIWVNMKYSYFDHLKADVLEDVLNYLYKYPKLYDKFLEEKRDVLNSATFNTDTEKIIAEKYFTLGYMCKFVVEESDG